MLAAKKRSLFAIFIALTSFSCFSFASTVYSTWNLEWLTSKPSSKFAPSQRHDGDFKRLNHYFRLLDSDILAFQEVNDAIALQRVVGPDYQLYFSQRKENKHRRHQFDEINQYTGFAVRKGIKVTNQPDIKLDHDSRSKLRFASYLVIERPNASPLHALSVHLKARCSGAYRNNRDCKTLKQQGEVLNRWIRSREAKGDSYIILGDFNHNLSYRKDWLLNTLFQETQAHLATRHTKASCKVVSRNNPNKLHQFRSLIDHVITSPDLKAKEVKQQVYQSNDLFKYQLSDHCPIRFEL